MRQLILPFAFLLSFGRILAQTPDTPKFVLLRSNYFGSFPKKCVAASLNKQELMFLEALFHKCVDEYNVDAKKRYNELKKNNPQIRVEDFILNIERYKRQYVVKKSLAGEKLVWVNCFCGSTNSFNKSWKEEIVFVHDGGNCYFNLMINLSKKRYYDLIVNGEA